MERTRNCLGLERGGCVTETILGWHSWCRFFRTFFRHEKKVHNRRKLVFDKMLNRTINVTTSYKLTVENEDGFRYGFGSEQKFMTA